MPTPRTFLALQQCDDVLVAYTRANHSLVQLGGLTEQEQQLLQTLTEQLQHFRTCFVKRHQQDRESGVNT